MNKRRKIQLTSEQKKTLKELFHKTKDTREKERYEAILLRDKAYKIGEMSDILERSPSVIKLWCNNYLDKGIEGIKSKPQPGNNRKLTNTEKNKIKIDINKYTPEELGYDGRFWAVKHLANYIRKEFNVTYKTKRSYCEIFKECGFSFHKPIKKDRRQDPEKVAKFEEDIKKNSKGIWEAIQLYW